MITSRTSSTVSPWTKPSPRLSGPRWIQRIAAGRCSGRSCAVVARGQALERGLRGIDELRRGERARLPVDRLHLRRLDTGDSVLLESPCLHEHLTLERAPPLVVGVDRALQRPA